MRINNYFSATKTTVLYYHDVRSNSTRLGLFFVEMNTEEIKIILLIEFVNSVILQDFLKTPIGNV